MFVLNGVLLMNLLCKSSYGVNPTLHPPETSMLELFI